MNKENKDKHNEEWENVVFVQKFRRKNKKKKPLRQFYGQFCTLPNLRKGKKTEMCIDIQTDKVSYTGAPLLKIVCYSSKKII